jgi:DNA-binding transcriptional ArsR family regulator
MKEFLVFRDMQKYKEAFDPSRKEILQLLSVREMSVDELAKLLGKDVSTVYRHMDKLVSAGLVKVAREEQVGPVTRKYYRRAARIMIGCLPAEETSDSEIMRGYIHDKMKKGVLALKRFNYDIREGNASADKIIKLAAEWEETFVRIMDRRMIEKEMVGDQGAFNAALYLLLLAETQKDSSLRKATQRLVSELVKHRGKTKDAAQIDETLAR